MRTYQETRTVRVGEWTDTIDADYDWAQHDWGDGSGGVNPKCTSEGRELILEIAANPELYRYSPCFLCVKDVLCAGMYDGWPFWRPTPAIGIRETLGYGIEAVWFYKLHAGNVYRKAGPVRRPPVVHTIVCSGYVGASGEKVACGKVMSQSPDADAPVSHGLCPECYAAFCAVIDGRKS